VEQCNGMSSMERKGLTKWRPGRRWSEWSFPNLCRATQIRTYRVCLLPYPQVDHLSMIL